MPYRTLKTANMISTVMLTVSVFLFLVSDFVTPWDCHFSFSDDFHIGLWAHGCDSRIVFFNDVEYGPYRGSIIGLADADGNVYPPPLRNESFGDSWGIYDRHFQ